MGVMSEVAGLGEGMATTKTMCFSLIERRKRFGYIPRVFACIRNVKSEAQFGYLATTKVQIKYAQRSLLNLALNYTSISTISKLPRRCGRGDNM